MSLDEQSKTYWRRKLSAYLHDSPDKVIDIADHEGRAKALAKAEGFQPNESTRKSADFAASAADRLPWPKSRVGDTVLCRSDFDPTDNTLRHPLGSAAIQFPMPFASPAAALDISLKTRPRIADDDPRAAFICAWRFWQNWASAADERFGCLPAETRLPDHTIWNHLAVTSAFQGCLGGSLKDWLDARAESQKPKPPPDRPAFLLFSIGPVQEFIAAARNTRDLWSGSYLLSYLVGTVLARIALDFGPDHVIFPNLANQPILDLLLRRELWDHHKAADGSELWQAFRYYDPRGKERLLTPSLPNRFLALLPATMAEHPKWQSPDDVGRTGAARYAAHLENEIREKLHCIARSVSGHCTEKAPGSVNAERFMAQVQKLLEVHWQVLPWPRTVKEALASTGHLPGEVVGSHPLDPLRSVLTMLNRMPKEHRDPWCFWDQDTGAEGKAGPLSQVSNAWSALFALVRWQLDAVKNTRRFAAWGDGGWRVDRRQNKDSLNGKEEACLEVPSDEKQAKALSRQLADGNENVFKPGDFLGASTLLKRLWHLTWLSKEHQFNPQYPDFDFAMPNTRSIAAHEPFAPTADDGSGTEEEGKYFAVLALDGDEMGKWVGGLKCPELAGQLSREAREYFEHEQRGNEAFLKARRPLSPSFHLQFSELLANFGLHCARRIVEAFDGRLIYSGGDDVLAILPADTAIPCARALRAAFRGERGLSNLAKGVVNRRSGKREQWKSDRSTPLFVVEHPGFIKLTTQAAPEGSGAEAGLLDEPVKFSFLVPGPAADCSVGIAIAHYKSPIQDVVRAAWDAERRAKNDLDRGAVAVTLMKRSGEITEWGCQWDSGGLELYHRMAEALEKEEVSTKFPHRVCELLSPYLTSHTSLSASAVQRVDGFQTVPVILRELDFVIGRQSKSGAAKVELRKAWLEERAVPERRSLVEKLCRWTTEQQARAAAKQVAKALQGHPILVPRAQRLWKIVESRITDDSSLAEHTLAELHALAQLADPALVDPCAHAVQQLERLRTCLQEAPLQALIGLCQTVAFAHRTAGNGSPAPASAPSAVSTSQAERRTA